MTVLKYTKNGSYTFKGVRYTHDTPMEVPTEDVDYLLGLDGLFEEVEAKGLEDKKPTGKKSAGKKPTDKKPTGKKPTGETSNDEKATGNVNIKKAEL